MKIVPYPHGNTIMYLKVVDVTDSDGNLKAKIQDKDGTMQIFVKTLNFGTITLDGLKGSDTIELTLKRVRRKIDNMCTGYDVECMIGYECLATFKGKQLEDERTLKHYNIQNESTIEMTFVLKGGGKNSHHIVKQTMMKIGRESAKKQHTEMTLETMKSLSSLSSTSTASTVALNRRLQNFWKTADDDPRKALQDEVGKMTPTDIADLINTINSKKTTNTAHYLEIISPELFGLEGRQVREIKEASSSALDASTACVQYAFNKGNLNMKDFKMLLNFSMNASSSSSAFRELIIIPSHKTRTINDSARPTPDFSGPTPENSEPIPEISEPTPDFSGPTPKISGPTPDFSGLGFCRKTRMFRPLFKSLQGILNLLQRILNLLQRILNLLQRILNLLQRFLDLLQRFLDLHKRFLDLLPGRGPEHREWGC